MRLVLMGVSGCGKTTIGHRLSDHSGEALQGSIQTTKNFAMKDESYLFKGLEFFDADDFHPESNA